MSITPADNPSRVTRVRHELVRRELRVLRVTSPTPGCRRVVLGGEQLQGFVSASFDDHVKLMFDLPDGHSVGRDFTPMAYDPVAGELSIEFMLHGQGPAACWAQAAQPGDVLRLGGPRGSFFVPTDFDWHLLAGDASALPAIVRRLAELPAHTRAIVMLQLPASERRSLDAACALDLRCYDDAAALLAGLHSLELPAGQGYAWCAGEATAAAALRECLVRDKGLGRHAIKAAAYWKRGASAHHETLGG